MTQDEIIEMAIQAGIPSTNVPSLAFGRVETGLELLEAFAKLVADKKEAEMQERIDQLYAMYEQACRQRDELMDQQRSMIARMRGQMQ
jgi:hypothetical protein